MHKKYITSLLVCTLAVSSYAQSSINISINQKLWGSFSKIEQKSLLEQFSSIEITPSEAIGVVQSVQSINRSTTGTQSGAMLGATLGQTMYIDRTFSGKNNYSATTQVGAALLGAVLGSSLDSAPNIRFIFNYAIKTLDGQIKEVRVESADEFTRPVGQCVLLPSVTSAEASLCSTDKVQFVKKLSALGQAPAGALVSNEASGINVNCRVPGVGLMTLDKNVCIQMEGSVEK